MKNETATSEKYVAGDGNVATAYCSLLENCPSMPLCMGMSMRYNR